MLMKVRLERPPERRGLRAHGGGSGGRCSITTDKGGGAVPTCLHLPGEQVALCIMETKSVEHTPKHGRTSLTHSPASLESQTRHLVKRINELNII